MMDTLQVLLGVAAVGVPAVLAAIARDRTLLAMIDSGANQLHDRINRIRDEFVRRDDLAEHLKRMEKQFDGVSMQLKELSSEIRQMRAEHKS